MREGEKKRKALTEIRSDMTRPGSPWFFFLKQSFK